MKQPMGDGQGRTDESGNASSEEHELRSQESILQEVEELLARQLIDEVPEGSEADAEAEAVRRLPPRWEIRIQTDRDPIVEETKAYRAIAQEIDDRYDDNKR
jgi:hypothetical protein